MATRSVASAIGGLEWDKGAGLCHLSRTASTAETPHDQAGEGGEAFIAGRADIIVRNAWNRRQFAAASAGVGTYPQDPVKTVETRKGSRTGTAEKTGQVKLGLADQW